MSYLQCDTVVLFPCSPLHEALVMVVGRTPAGASGGTSDGLAECWTGRSLRNPSSATPQVGIPASCTLWWDIPIMDLAFH